MNSPAAAGLFLFQQISDGSEYDRTCFSCKSRRRESLRGNGDGGAEHIGALRARVTGACVVPLPDFLEDVVVSLGNVRQVEPYEIVVQVFRGDTGKVADELFQAAVVGVHSLDVECPFDVLPGVYLDQFQAVPVGEVDVGRVLVGAEDGTLGYAAVQQPRYVGARRLSEVGYGGDGEPASVHRAFDAHLLA